MKMYTVYTIIILGNLPPIPNKFTIDVKSNFNKYKLNKHIYKN